MEELNMIKGYKEMYKDQNTFGFYDKVISNAKKVEVVSYKDIPELKEIIDKHLTMSAVVPKECYKNSCEPVIGFLGHKDLKYVEGLYTFYGLPIHHAWNVWKDEVYVDLTMEVHGRLEVGDSYISCLELSPEILRGHLLKSGMWGPFIAQHYTNGQAKYLPFGI
jgi:hypothetical protein